MTKTKNYGPYLSGSTLIFTFPVKIEGVAEDLSGYEIDFGIADGPESTNDELVRWTLADGDLEVVDKIATNDAYRVTLSTTFTEPLEGDYYYEARITDPDGQVGYPHNGVLSFSHNLLEPAP